MCENNILVRSWFKYLFIALCLVSLSGCGVMKNASSERKTANKVIAAAKGKLGCKYLYGAKGPKNFDCSGLTSYAFAQAGMKIPVTVDEQRKIGKRLGRNEALHPGDLVFFSSRYKKGISHVGIVVSYNPFDKSFTFIHAATSTGVEIQSSTHQYYAERYLFANRIIGK